MRRYYFHTRNGTIILATIGDSRAIKAISSEQERKTRLKKKVL
jgi:hypothetical protein